jgi:hypothetical protein
MAGTSPAMTKERRIETIQHLLLDRVAQMLAAIMRRYPPRAHHTHCPKAACRRARKCHARNCSRAGNGAHTDACVGRMHAHAGRSHAKHMP